VVYEAEHDVSRLRSTLKQRLRLQMATIVTPPYVHAAALERNYDNRGIRKATQNDDHQQFDD
jgi:hypothetical protein